jgi:hypothetical protein
MDMAEQHYKLCSRNDNDFACTPNRRFCGWEKKLCVAKPLAARIGFLIT